MSFNSLQNTAEDTLPEISFFALLSMEMQAAFDF